MYRAFIVDDEAYVREGLKTHFPWHEYGIELAGMAADGTEALERLLESPVDLLITDVKMPRMGGIELVRTLMDSGANCKTIFISGYDDVSYLHSALKLDAIDYIMKSIDLDELATTVSRVVEIMENERLEAERQSQFKAQLNNSMPFLRAKALAALLRDCTLNETLKWCEQLGLNLRSDGDFCIGVMVADNLALLYGDKNETDKQILSMGMVNAAQEQMLTTMQGYFFEKEPGVLVALAIVSVSDRSECEMLMAEFLDATNNLLRRYFNCSFSFGQSGITRGVGSLAVAYENAFRSASTFEVPQASKGSFAFSQRCKLIAALGACDKATVRKLMEISFVEAAQQGNEIYERAALFAMLLLPIDLIDELALEADYNLLKTCEGFYLCNSAGERRMFVLSAYESLLLAVESRRSRQSIALVEQMKRTMRDRFSEDLQIIDIAKAAFLSGPYACQLFKQNTGMTIGQYLTQTRLEKAKELLTNPGRKACEVGYDVGYDSPSHFSRLFKRFSGFTPSQYRNIMVSDSNEAKGT